MLNKIRIPGAQILCWIVAFAALIATCNVDSEDKMSAAIIAAAFAICAVILRAISVYQEVEAYKLVEKIEDEVKR